MLSISAQIADLLAAAGVIASLVFLGVQLRAQNRETEIQAWRDMIGALSTFKSVTNDPVMADLVERGHADYGALTPAEKRAFGLYLEQGLHAIGNFDKLSGTVPKRFEHLHLAIDNTMLDHLGSAGARAWWAETKPKGRFLPSTTAKIDDMQAPGRVPHGPHL